MKQGIFAALALLVFIIIISVGQHYKQREVDSTFAEAQKRVESFPDMPTVKPEVLIPNDLIEKELAKIQETEKRAQEEAAKAQAEAQAAQDKLAADAKAEKERIAAELAAAKKQEQLKAGIPSLGGAADEAKSEVDQKIDDIFGDANETVNAATTTVTETVETTTAAAAVPVADPVQMDEDGLPLKASAVTEQVDDATVAMADRLGQAVGTAEDAVGTATALSAELPTMAAQTLGPKVVILGYHQFKDGADWGNSSHVTPVGVLKEHLAALKENGYEVVPLSQVRAALKGEAQLPPKAAVLTVDNGFNNALKIAAPEFQKNEMPWSFFVFTNLVSTGATGATWDELLVSVQDENFDVQSQTYSHLFLTRPKGRDDKHYGEFLEKELNGSRSTIEQRLNQSVYALAYPFGNYNDDITAKAKEYGYDTMLTTEPGFVDFSKGPGALDSLPRFIVTKESAEFVDDFIGENPLYPTDISPRPGAVDATVRPEIKLTLAPSVKLDPASVEGSIKGVAETKATYDEATNTITLTPQSDLDQRAIRVTVRAKTPDGEDTGLSWYYYFEPKLLPNE